MTFAGGQGDPPRDEAVAAIGGGVYAGTDYESDSVVAEYLAFHYPHEDALRALLGPAAPAEAERYPFALRSFWEGGADAVALDVGAAVGRVTAELAKDHRYAVGLDFSPSLVGAAARVRNESVARYRVVVEGDLTEQVEVPVEPFPNAAFLVGDAAALPFADGVFGTVTALNLVDRVPDPKRALAELGRVLAIGGTLVLSSPYTWVNSFTPRERWLGGFVRDGAPVRARDEIRAQLSPAFEFQKEASLPFFIRHHARSGQLAVSHVQSFRRTS